MPKFDEAGAPAKTFIKQALPDAIDPLEVIESVASTLDDFEESQWLIKRMIECGTLGQIFSGWNVGKSALAVDIACRVATGLDFAGRKVCQGPVLYIAAEGGRGLKRRFKGWEEINGITIPSSLYRTRISVRLPEEGNAKMLKSALSYIEDKHGRPPLLVIIDTLAQTMVGEQNSTSEVDQFTATLREVFSDSAVMLLHHVGHADKQRGRGASSLPAACDWEFRLENINGSVDAENIIKYVRLVNTKQRDEELQSDFCFSLIRVVLGEDEDGEELTTVVPDYLPNLIAQSARTARWGPHMTKALSMLDQMIGEHLEDQDVDPDDVRVLFSDWQSQSIKSGIKPDTFRTIKKRLIDHGEIQIDGHYVSRVQA